MYITLKEGPSDPNEKYGLKLTVDDPDANDGNYAAIIEVDDAPVSGHPNVTASGNAPNVRSDTLSPLAMGQTVNIQATAASGYVISGATVDPASPVVTRR